MYIFKYIVRKAGRYKKGFFKPTTDITDTSLTRCQTHATSISYSTCPLLSRLHKTDS